MRKHLLAILGAAATTTLASHAIAQDAAPSIQLNQYEQPVAGDAFFAAPAPWVGGHLVPRAMISFDYADDPLVLVDEDDNVLAAPVTSQAHLHFGFSFALWDRLGISLNFPLAVSQGGDEAGGNPALQAAEGAEPGDLRIGLRGRLYGEYWDAFQLGVGGYLYVPTGPEGGYTSEGGIYGKPHLLFGGHAGDHFVWSAAAGAVVRDSDNPHTFTYSAGVGVVILDNMLQLGPEIFGSVDLEDKPLFGGTGATPAVNRVGSANTELLLGAKFRFLDDFVVGAAAGPGLSNGVGTPTYRIIGSFAYDPQPPKEKPPVVKPKPKDKDGDGILDKNDACVDTPGIKTEDPETNGCPDTDGDGIFDKDDACIKVKGVPHEDPGKHGCPPPGDKDGDGIIDPEDACIDVPGEEHDDPKKNGCPPDTDGDGIYDKDDACVDVPGVESEDPKKHGCPPDKDGDGILDPDDACIDVPGVKDPDPKKNGCPKVVVTAKEIKILEKIQFDFDKATIKPVSDPVIDAVAKVMKENPEILLIEIQGHTDNKGTPFYNRALSDRRAKSVKDALIKRGVDAKRLRSKGYGQAKPIATNKTKEGRATNRRVQFQIIKKKKKKKKK